MSSGVPADAPPPYTGGPSSSAGHSRAPAQHKIRNGIPPEARRSMEDEQRPLPKGWTRQYDPETKHQFFVDTTQEPPRSIWTHPYDDTAYLSTLPVEERNRVLGLHSVPSHADIEAESTDEDDDNEHDHGHHTDRATDPDRSGANKEKKLGRRLKDKLTGSTHEEREAKRRKRAAEERRAYEVHNAMRNAMSQAMQTGQPVRAMRDKDGHDIYVEPPDGYSRPQQAQYDNQGRTINPYGGNPYNDPNARFIRPPPPYQRGYGYGGGYGGYGGGYGYGGGFGMPMMGGLAGGLLLGGLLF